MHLELDHHYARLRDLIDQVGHGKSKWMDFSHYMLHLLDASYIHIQAIDFAHNVLSFSNGIGPLPPQFYATAELDYLRYPLAADPRWERFLAPSRTGWYQCHTHLSDEFVKQSEVYQKILLPCNLRYVASHVLIRDEALCVFWSISTSLARQPLDCRELAFLNRLLPHLSNVVLAQRHLYEFSVDHLVGFELIDKLTQPIMLLTLSGQVVHYNQAMQVLLSQTASISISNQQLVLPQPAQRALQDTLYQMEAALRYQQQQLDVFRRYQFAVQAADCGGWSFRLQLLASKKQMAFFGVRPLVMLEFETCQPLASHQTATPATSYQLSHAKLKQAYQLTPREMQACELFVNGMNLEQMARAMQITHSTMRTYLKSIFAKTHCSSQVQLIRLLVSLSNPVEPRTG